MTRALAPVQRNAMALLEHATRARDGFGPHPDHFDVRTAEFLLLLRKHNPLESTPPHEPRFGDYARELGQYRLEAWALRVLRAGFEVVDHFQTRDVNWVLVTRPLDDASAAR